MKFRSLKANEIDVFPKIVKESGCMALLYKDARCDMNILDETVGSMNWKREHMVVNNNLFCTVSIYDKEKEEWIGKQDVGVESFAEKVKGQASDSFKRACFNWGIGRELYTIPFIWIRLNKGETYKVEGKFKLNSNINFKVSKIKTIDGRITSLEIIDQKGNKRFSWDDKSIDENNGGIKVSKTSEESTRNKKVKKVYALAEKLAGFDKETMDGKVNDQYNKTEVKFLNNKELEEVLLKWEDFGSKKSK
ncbi:hypothetical protein [Dethiothermospora halolimnae]|uniref:hypothetical protein n=1 Tax=Dethiothermospora halolimnae TaxID=3114390 RepID=UPI003CCC2ACF